MGGFTTDLTSLDTSVVFFRLDFRPVVDLAFEELFVDTGDFNESSSNISYTFSFKLPLEETDAPILTGNLLLISFLDDDRE